MKEEIKEVLYLAISLSIAAVFLMLVLTFSGIGYNITYATDAKLAKNARMSEQAEVYKYVTDGGMDNPQKLVTGADIVRFITKNTTRYKYRIYFTDTAFVDIEYGSDEHEDARDKILELMDVTAGTASTDQYYIADMSLWSQQYLNNEILKENVYGTFVPYVTMIDTGEVTEDLDVIVDAATQVRFNFKLKD